MFETDSISENELQGLLAKQETHYLDFKAAEVSAKDLQRHLVGFANADGGELYVGIDDNSGAFAARGFTDIESANQLVSSAITDIMPTIEGLSIDFLVTPISGNIVRFVVPKSPSVHYTSSGDCYLRLSAQTQKVKGESIASLAYSKGFFRYEDQTADASTLSDILESSHIHDFLNRIGSKQDPERFLRRNRLLDLQSEGSDKLAVGCVLLFDDDPDEVLSTKASVKILRMKTTSEQYTREQLASHEKLSGPLESLVRDVEDRILEIMRDASFEVDGVRFEVNYPEEAVHEILVNAFLHRDYSIADEVQVTIFDNRIEIRSPGRLPGSVTVANILNAHFARNPNLVRLINKLPKPLNHDLGEGLDTAFRAMNQAGLVSPEIEEKDGSVVVMLRHKKIASYEELIMNYLSKNEWITNKIARGLTGEGSENKVKSALQRLRSKGLIEPEDPNANPFQYRYRKVEQEESMSH
jgi:ATP-dependent DNA helicase RecG